MGTIQLLLMDVQITLGGDIILKIDNKDIQNIHDVLAYIESKKNVGDNMLVTVLRNGIIQFNTVKLGSNPNYLPQLNSDKELEGNLDTLYRGFLAKFKRRL